MTERTLLKQTRAEFEDDSISTASSHSEQYSSDQEFLVERILAEKKGQDGKIYYLILWANYQEEKSTWEPKKNIQDPDILRAWKCRKDQETRGVKPSFDIDKFNARCQQLARDKADRHRRRKIKRKRRGIPVSPDPEPVPSHINGSNSIGVVEPDGAPQDDPGTRRKSKATPKTTPKTTPKAKKVKKANKAIKQLLVQPGSSDDETRSRRRSSNQKGEGESEGAVTSDGSLTRDIQRKVDTKVQKEKASQTVHDKRAAQGTLKVSARKDKHAAKKLVSTRQGSFSSTSSEAHLAEQRLQTQQQQQQSLLQQQRAESTDTTISKQLANAIKSSSTPATANTPREKPPVRSRRFSTGTDALTVGRGRGATRGGSSLAPKNVFASRGPSRKRPTLIENAADVSKDPKHFNNWHLRRKAELAGRQLADAAPDIAALGGLFAPSNPSNFQSLKPATLRKVLNSPPSQQGSDFRSRSIDTEEIFDEPNSDGDLAEGDVSAPIVDVVNLAPVYRPPPHSIQPSRPVWQERDGYKAICSFWHTRGNCIKGYQCSYQHTDDSHLPIAPPPPGFNHKSTSGLNSTIEERSPAAGQSKRPWRERDGFRAICYFWHNKGTCSKGHTCSYQHTDDINLPISPAPPGHHSYYSPDISPDDHYSPPPHSPAEETIPPATASKLHEPPWENRDDRPERLKAVCFFWHTRGTCTKGDTCGYFHTYEGDLPIAVAPNRASELKSETCRFWAKGFCKKSDEDCPYLHGHELAPSSDHDPSESRQQEEPLQPSPVVRDSPVTIPTDLRKSVSFAIDKPIASSEEPESSNIPPSVSDQHPKYMKTCTFWIKGNCWRGNSCHYWHSDDGSDKINDQNSTMQPIKEHLMEDSAFRTEQQATQQDVNSASIADLESTVHGTEFVHPDRISRLQSAATNPGIQMEEPTRSLETDSTISSFRAKAQGTNEYQQAKNTISHSQTQSHLVNDEDTPQVHAPKKKCTKVTMKEYRRNKTTKALGDRIKEVAFGKDETKFVVVDFGDISHAKQHPSGQLFVDITKLHFTQICLAQDFKVQRGSLLGLNLLQGSLVAEPTDQDSVKTIDKAWEYLRLSLNGFVCICVDFVVLIYPATEEWNFIEGPASLKSEVKLRYLVYQTNLDLSVLPDTRTASNTAEYKRSLVEAIHGLNFETFVPKIRPKQRYHFFLLFPSTASRTADFVANWLRMSSNQSKIYSSQREGAWDFFVKDPSVDIGIVLIHESAIVSVCELPSFRALIQPSIPTKTITFWYIAEGTAEIPMYGPPEGSSLGQITATRLFPHGHAFFLTPSFFIAEPDKAYTLMRWFKGKFANSTRGTWNLVCAHNIRDYLLDLAIEKSAERDEIETMYQGQARKDAIMEEKGLGYATCKLRFQIHELIVDLLSQPSTENYSDYDSDMPDESVSPVIYADQFVDADDEKALVTWFAGWAMCRLDRFRKFTVVGTAPRSEKRAVRRKALILQRSKVGKPFELGSPKLDDRSQPESPRKYGLSNPRAPKPSEEVNFESPKSRTRFKNHPTIVLGEPPKTTINSQTLAPKCSPQDSDIRMSTETDIVHNPESPTKKYGIDIEASSKSLQFIKHTGTDLKTARAYLAKSNNDAKRAVQLYYLEMGSHPIIEDTEGPFSRPIKNKSLFNPSQFDGAGDARLVSSGANSVRSSRSGTQSDENSRTLEHNASGRNIPHHAIETSAEDRMEVDSPAVEEDVDAMEIVTKEIRYEATTTWYGRSYREGKGWEHVYVESWEKAFKYLNVT